MTERASCDDCGKQYPRDPVLEVACPVCRQPVGKECVARAPSGHVKSRAFALPPWGHNERDLLACAEGKYGECPRGGCGIPPDECRRRLAAGETRRPRQNRETGDCQPSLI